MIAAAAWTDQLRLEAGVLLHQLRDLRFKFDDAVGFALS